MALPIFSVRGLSSGGMRMLPSTRTLSFDLKRQVIFVLGGPGSGKGTQSLLLAKELGFPHISAGETLVEERDSGSPDGNLINQYIANGKIVPVSSHFL